MKRQMRAALCSSVALAAMAAASVPVIAQEITSSIRGTVVTPSGAPAAGQTVQITDTRTGSVKTVTTNASGSFNVRSLIVGGPYTIRVISDDYQNSTITDVMIGLSGGSSFNIALTEAADDVEEISVVASKIASTTVAVGPSSSFGLTTIERQPTISRQVRDVVRIDPRVSIGRSNGGNGYGINCLGGNNRSNSFTIDGIRSADGFGLNASGNLARNTFPIPFDSMAAASVEFAPVSVEYGQFTGCNVNVVTKSGTNEFHGSAFYVYNDGGLTGTELEDQVVRSEPFKDKNWGAELGGPIIEDKMFFYVSYEETDGGSSQNNGPIGGGFANEAHLTLDDANQIADILSTSYGRDTLGLVRTLPETSRRYFARIDWNLNDNHRLAATYSHLEESNVESDDYGFDGFTFADNFEREGSESDTYSLRIYSDWTDNFSTEFRVSTSKVVDLQNPLGGGEAQDENPKPRIEVQDGTGTTIFTSGPGTFRSANALEYTQNQVKLAGDYVMDDHTITFGYELDQLDVYNLFAANGTGTIEFASIADLQAGLASRITRTGSYTGDINDAAAQFKRNIHTLYVQDEWAVNDALTVTAGLRYDWYDSNDVPIESQPFVDRYGFSNAVGFNNLDVFMPRVGLKYDLPESFGETTLTAGFGIFSGGDPTVWFSNAFTNFGSSLGSGSDSGAGCTAADLQVLNGGSFTGIPDCIAAQEQASALAGTGRVDAIDPDLKVATQQRFSLGLSHFTDTDSSFFSEWQVNVDFIYSKSKNEFDFVDLTLSPNGVTLPDGRPQYTAIDPLHAGCNATFAGPRVGFTNINDLAACDAGSDDQDILLTNADESGSTTSISFQMSKNFQLAASTFFDFRAGYAYTDTKIGNPGNSSTATSGFEEVAVALINYPEIAPAQYNNKHNIVISGTLDHDFVEDYTTSFSFFFRARSGRPFSYVYDNNTPTTLFGDSDNEERNLFYVPTGADDPLVDFSSLEAAGTLDDFFAFLENSGLNEYAGEITPRNTFEQNWSTDLDIRIQQELPTFFDGHKLELFVDFENVLNLLGNGNNIQRYADNGDVGEGVPVLDAALSGDGTQYIYSNFNPGGGSTALSTPGFDVVNQRDVDDSLWRIQIGVKYKF